MALKTYYELQKFNATTGLWSGLTPSEGNSSGMISSLPLAKNALNRFREGRPIKEQARYRLVQIDQATTVTLLMEDWALTAKVKLTEGELDLLLGAHLTPTLRAKLERAKDSA